MSKKLSSKVVIITGATSGIGKATALLFAKEDAIVVITGRRSDLGEQVEREVKDGGARCLYIHADHSKEEDCVRVVDRTLSEFGRIDVLFNNAGIVTQGTAETTTEEIWHRTLDINVTAIFRMCKHVIPHMKSQGTGVIVNNGSDWSIVGGRNALAYVTSKGAVAAMTKAMALDHARDGIRVNAVCPGDTAVERWSEKGYSEGSGPVSAEEAAQAAAELPMGRVGTPAEVAKAVLFLASDDSSFITGHLLLVDGGNTAR